MSQDCANVLKLYKVPPLKVLEGVKFKFKKRYISHISICEQRSVLEILAALSLIYNQTRGQMSLGAESPQTCLSRNHDLLATVSQNFLLPFRKSTHLLMNERFARGKKMILGNNFPFSANPTIKWLLKVIFTGKDSLCINARALLSSKND